MGDLILPPGLERERRNGGDIDAYRKQIHNLGVLARVSSKDKRATFRGEFTPGPARPNRKQRRAMKAGAR